MTTAQILPEHDALGTMVQMLVKLKPQMRAALPKHLSPERMARITTTTLRRTPRLLECVPISLAGAIIQACQLGLEPDGWLGEYYLTPRRLGGIWNVVGIPGYRGLMKLAHQAGGVDWIVAHVVYEGDDFHFEYGDTPRLLHKPGSGAHEDRLITHAYAVAKLRTGSTVFWAMRRADVDKVRDTWAAAKDEGPWITHYPEMCMKTVVRRLCKFLPQSTALGRAIALDEAAEAGLPQGLEALVETEELGLPAKKSTLDRIGDALETRKTPPAAGADTAPSGGGPVTHAPAPSTPPPPAADRPSGRPGPTRKRFPRLPQDVEQPARIAEPPQEAPSVAPLSPGPALDPDAPSHTFPAPEALAEVTPTNVFDLLRRQASEAELDRYDDHVRASTIYRGWGEPQRQVYRDAVNLTRKRLPVA